MRAPVCALFPLSMGVAGVSSRKRSAVSGDPAVRGQVSAFLPAGPGAAVSSSFRSQPERIHEKN